MRSFSEMWICHKFSQKIQNCVVRNSEDIIRKERKTLSSFLKHKDAQPFKYTIRFDCQRFVLEMLHYFSNDEMIMNKKAAQPQLRRIFEYVPDFRNMSTHVCGVRSLKASLSAILIQSKKRHPAAYWYLEKRLENVQYLLKLIEAELGKLLFYTFQDCVHTNY